MNSGISVYLAAPFAAWIVAQVAKVVVAAVKSGGKKDLSIFLKSGNMPSSHTAVMVSLLVTLGVREGMDSAVFAVAAVASAVIIYDALNVRRSVGEQGRVLQEMLKTSKSTDTFHHAEGHRPTEVVVGGIIGLALSIILLQIL